MSEKTEPDAAGSDAENPAVTMPKKPPALSLMAARLKEQARQKIRDKSAKGRAFAMGKKSGTRKESSVRAKLRIDIQPDRSDWVVRQGLWDIGIFSDYKAAIAEGVRMAQRQMAEAIFIHNRGGRQYMVWQRRMG